MGVFCLMQSVLMWVFITVMKHYDQKKVGEERIYFYLVYTSTSIVRPSLKKVRTGTQDSKLEVGTMYKHGFPTHSLDNFLSFSLIQLRTTCLGMFQEPTVG